MQYKKYKKSSSRYRNIDQYDPEKELDKYFKRMYRIDINPTMTDRQKRIAYSDMHNKYSSKSINARLYSDNFKTINPDLYATSSDRWEEHHEKHKDDWYNDHLQRQKSLESRSARKWEEYHEKHKDDWYEQYKKSKYKK